jgi:Notch-like protein
VPPQTETCNGIDDNCNEQIDETFLVAPFNLNQACDGNDSDACADGVFVCNPLDDNATVCLETGAPKVEICDGIDNDCDDLADETFPTVGQACDSNPQDGDLCLNDIIVCNTADRTTTTCQQVVAPQVELCNSFDDNCNGQVDETFVGGFWKLGEACDGADGDACNEGVFVCASNQNSTVCSDNTTTNDELCNGLDDNCNGQTDENWKADNTVGFTGINGRFLGQTCDGTNDADLCLNGTIECSLDFTTVYCHESAVGIAEVCDLAGTGDEDCDGQINEGFDLGGACITDDLGVCKTAGTLACDERRQHHLGVRRDDAR